MEIALLISTLIAIVLAIVSALLFLSRLKLYRKYGQIIDVQAEVERAQEELKRAQGENQRTLEKEKSRVEELRSQYAKSKEFFDRLTREVSLLEEQLNDISYGLYKPHFDFQTSEEYQKRLEEIRNRRKEMLREGKAATCTTEWKVGESKQAGARMVKQYSKVMLRAFNAEVEAGLSNVAWNNIGKIEERLKKAFQTINELGSQLQISLSSAYLEICLKELYLTHELQEKRHAEQEEQREIREKMREEERAQKELERAQREAEDEEKRYAKALEKAQSELQKASGIELEELKAKMQSLERQLAEAKAQKERAISQAQLTRSGYIYVISNIGSFGENVFKIGMTRRLDPMDRVRELGDASVPFPFDVHAMLYSLDAPTLEGELHGYLENRRLNLVNPRKEFFAVSLEELDEFAKKNNVKLELTKLAEAKEYRESVAMRTKTDVPITEKADKFPDELPLELEA